MPRSKKLGILTVGMGAVRPMAVTVGLIVEWANVFAVRRFTVLGREADHG